MHVNRRQGYSVRRRPLLVGFHEMYYLKEAGETRLVLGAAGGIGFSTVEIGTAMRTHVIAAASTTEKLAAPRHTVRTT
ncbi:hypothetical protein NKDENANG_03406 [Candidatus Entotheonellaceae bacterium PAL068K]